MIKNVKRNPGQKIKGVLIPPPDKSISHRSIIFAAIGQGKSHIYNLLEAEDCKKTLKAFQQMGIEVSKKEDYYEVIGTGHTGLREPDNIIDCGNSGTTMRLLAGLLSGQKGNFSLDGDSSLRKRPMQRIIKPLKSMKADIRAVKENNYCPLIIKPAELKAIDYKLPVASAQLKSALLLANLYTNEKMVLREPKVSRNHTEIMMKQLGFDIKYHNLKIVFNSQKNTKIPNNKYYVPGDFSQAAYFITAALLIENSELLIKDVNLNPTRTGFLEVIKEMGANIDICDKRQTNGEIIGNILVKHSKLKGINVEEDLIPKMIDEIPLIAVLALKADGKTKVTAAKELRVKETDRLKNLKNAFNKLELSIDVFADGFSIKGPQTIDESVLLNTECDHRMAMTYSILALLSKYGLGIDNYKCINNSFPTFFDKLDKILH